MNTKSSFKKSAGCQPTIKLPGFVVVTLVLFTALTPNLAYPDTYNGTPTQHIVVSHSPSLITAFIANGFRPTSIEVESNVLGMIQYRVAYVKNEGSHYQPVLFLNNVTTAQIDARVASGWRVEDVEIISSGTVPRLSAILVLNVANPQETFYFHGWNADSITLKLALWNGRLIDLDRHSISGFELYSGVMVKNTGVAGADWGWGASKTWSEIGAYATANSMRVIDLDRHPDGTYAVVFVKRNLGERTQYFGNRTLQQVQDLIAGGGFRVTSLNETTVNNTRRYSGAMVNNANPIAARVANLVLPKHNGFQGLYLRQMNGPEIVNLNGARAFHPSSAIKFLVHYHAADVTSYSELNTRIIENETMVALCQDMMLDSDNTDTNTLMSHFGKATIQNNGRADGPMSNQTALINDMDTGGPYNNNPFTTTTLVDMGQLYERVQVGNTLGQTKVDWIRSNMRNESNSTLFNSVNRSVRNQTRISSTKYDRWRAQVRWIFKNGNNTNPSNQVNGFWTCCGSISLPFQASNGTVTYRVYVYGLFVNESTTHFPSGSDATAELLREQILASMNTFK